jgi:hypothetical protein
MNNKNNANSAFNTMVALFCPVALVEIWIFSFFLLFFWYFLLMLAQEYEPQKVSGQKDARCNL